MRICTLCKQDHHVSNRVLFFTYGIRACDIVDKYGHLISYTGLERFRRPKEYVAFTRNPIDIADRPELMFFWKPDLERVVDLEAARQTQNERVAAINRIKAHIASFAARLAVWTNPAHRTKPTRYGVERVLEIEFKRHSEPLSKHLRCCYTIGGPAKLAWVISRNTGWSAEKTRTELRMMQKMRMNVPAPILGFDETTVRTYLNRLNLRVEDIEGDPWFDDKLLTYTGRNWTLCNSAWSVRSIREGKPVRLSILADPPQP